MNEFCIVFLDLIRFDRIRVSLCILLWGWRDDLFRGHGVAETNKSWEALGSPREMHVTVGHNSRNDPEKSKDFLRSAERIGSETDLLIQGDVCETSLTPFNPLFNECIVCRRKAVGEKTHFLNPSV